jgi:5'-deoxynucleotidase YfbR-like HD superfamily hydrolase
MKQPYRLLNLLESGEVQRFHAAPSVPIQTVGHHAWGVTAIARYIREDPSADFLFACLVHDAPELYTGDIPFTTKRESPLLRAMLGDIEEKYTSQHLFAPVSLTQTETTILKVSDMLEGLRWAKLNERLTAGNQVVAGRWQNAIAILLSSADAKLVMSDEEWSRANNLFIEITNI